MSCGVDFVLLMDRKLTQFGNSKIAPRYLNSVNSAYTVYMIY